MNAAGLHRLLHRASSLGTSAEIDELVRDPLDQLRSALELNNVTVRQIPLNVIEALTTLAAKIVELRMNDAYDDEMQYALYDCTWILRRVVLGDGGGGAASSDGFSSAARAMLQPFMTVILSDRFHGDVRAPVSNENPLATPLHLSRSPLPTAGAHVLCRVRPRVARPGLRGRLAPRG